MLPIAKKILIIVGLFSTSFAIAHTATVSRDRIYNQHASALVEDLIFESSRFSQPDDLTLVDPDDFVTITRKDEEKMQNDNFILYYNKDTLAIKVLNKSTGYVWSTAIDRAQAGTFTELLESGIGFEYYSVQKNYNNRKNVGIIDTEFEENTVVEGNTLNVDVSIDGACSDRTCERYYDFYVNGDISLEDMIELYNYVELNLGFSFQVTLTDTGIEFYLPMDSIYEGNPESIILSSIIVFPGMGATYLDDIPGYMMIPDGSGALIRYEDNQGKFVSPYESRYYGNDYGISTRISSLDNYRLTLPIFGAVHGVNQNAFLGTIESGVTNARLVAFPNGATNVDYNLIYNKFDLKQTYTQSFTTDRIGGAPRVYESQDQDIHVRYDFLDNDQANYVGMAQAYQQQLIDQGVFAGMDVAGDQIPIHLQYLMADSRSRFIGKEIIEMTDVDAVESMYTYFINQGLVEQRVSLLGWNDGGYSGHLPSDVDFENSLGRNRDFLNLIDLIEKDNEVLLVNNYVIGSNNSTGLRYGQDVAEAVDRFKLEYTCESCVYPGTYLLYPDFSYERAMDDLSDYKSLGVDLMFESLGSILFTYFDGRIHTRYESLMTYEKIIEAYGEYAQYSQPNHYAFRGLESYYNLGLYNNQYNFFDDLVPVLPIVLSGHVEMFSQNMNYNSLGKTQLLMLVDYNVYPSYMLTEERPSALTGSDVEYFYASQFDVWKDTIIEEYQWINQALSHVQGAEIISRSVPNQGIALVTYDNGVSILINYTATPYMYEGLTIEPLNYLVRGV